MSNIKVLQGNNMWDEEVYEDLQWPEIPTIFNRDGRYYDRHLKVVWVEQLGRAWMEPRTDDFEYKLDMLNHRPLMGREITAMKTIIGCSRKGEHRDLKDRLYKDHQWKETRECVKRARIARLRLYKEK